MSAIVQDFTLVKCDMTGEIEFARVTPNGDAFCNACGDTEHEVKA